MEKKVDEKMNVENLDCPKMAISVRVRLQISMFEYKELKLELNFEFVVKD